MLFDRKVKISESKWVEIKLTIESLKSKVNYLTVENDLLKKENDKLKAENDDMKKDEVFFHEIDRLKKENTELKDKLNQVQKENEKILALEKMYLDTIQKMKDMVERDTVDIPDTEVSNLLDLRA